MRKWVYFIALFVLLIVCSIAFLPVILSSQWGRERALAMATPHLPGTMQIESWSLRWFGEQEIKGLSYADESGAVRVTQGDLVAEKGLLALLLNRSELGTITLTGPQIEIRLPGPGASQSGGEQPSQPNGGSDGGEPAAPGDGSPVDTPFSLPPISGGLVVADATIGIATGENPVTTVAQDVELTLLLNTAADDISYTMAMVSPDQTGRIWAEGTVTTAAAMTPGAIGSAGELSLKAWNISPLLELAAAYADVPRGGGILDGTLSHDGVLDDGIQVDGALDLTSLSLTGGVLGDDQPLIDLASVVFASRIGRNKVELDSLTLSSPSASGSLSGVFAGQSVQGDTRLTVDLATLAGQIPHTLNLQEGVRITGGVLDLAGRVISEQGRYRFDINSRLEGLAGTQGDTDISLSEPFTLSAVGGQDADGLALEQFSVDSSFLQGRGQGDLNNMEVSLEADLGAALAEISQFVSLPDYAVQGRLTGSLQARRKDETTVSVTADLSSERLLVHQGDTIIIPGKPLRFSGVVDLPLSAEFDLSGIDTVINPRLSYQSWLGQGSARADLFEVASSRLTGLVFSGQTDLAGVSTVLGALGALPDGLTLGGENTSSIQLDYSAEGIELASLTSETADFVLAMDGKSYQDTKMVITTSGAIDPEAGSVSLAPLRIDSANGTIALERLAIDNWAALDTTLSGAGWAGFDLGTVLSAVADWYVPPPDIATTGAVELTMTGAPAGDGLLSYTIGAELQNFSLTAKDARVFTDETATILLDGTRAPSTGALEITQLAVNTPLVTLGAAGFVRPASEEGEAFSISGELGMDLGRIGALVRSLSELDLVMAGGGARPFTLRGSFNDDQGDRWWNHIDFNGSIDADEVKIMGIELSGLEIPIAISEGRAHADVQGTINQGTLAVQPFFDMGNEPPVLTIPEGRVISDMQLTREVAENFLARIHPLFRGAGQMSGAVDLFLDRFYWPLGAEHADKRQFSGTIDLAEVQLQSSAMLGTLLQTLGADNSTLDLSGEQIRFAAQDGRITTTPLTTNLSDTDLVVSGSMGFDTSLDYLVQAEVTQALVGAEVYEYLEGTIIRVPIGGTLANPDISVQTVQRAATDLINQAARQRLQEEAGKLLEGLFN